MKLSIKIVVVTLGVVAALASCGGGGGGGIVTNPTSVVSPAISFFGYSIVSVIARN